MSAVNGKATGVKTLLVGWDGATFTVLNELMAQGVMPFLKGFLEGGVRANLRTIIPALTPPAWTSLMTGRTPGYHGVFDFFRFEGQNSKHIRFFTSSDIQTETIWNLASKNGMRAASMNFPSMYPAPHISGYVVPGWVPWRQMRLACWPKDLFDRLKALPEVTLRELGMDIKLEEKSTEGVGTREEYGPWIEFHTRRERNWFEIYKYLTANDPSELTAVLFDGVDKMQHLCWRFIRPQDAEPLKEEWEFCGSGTLPELLPAAGFDLSADGGAGGSASDGAAGLRSWFWTDLRSLQREHLAGKEGLSGMVGGGRNAGETDCVAGCGTSGAPYVAAGLEQDASVRHNADIEWN